jgi:hypothetical protein
MKNSDNIVMPAIVAGTNDVLIGYYDADIFGHIYDDLLLIF